MLSASSDSAMERLLPLQSGTHPCALGQLSASRNWHAVTVYPRHERYVAHFLKAKGVDYLLPLYSSLRRWKDRRKQVEMVLFPGYVFVNIGLEARIAVLKVPGVARFVTFQERPAVIPDYEIQAIGTTVKAGIAMQPHPYLKKGQRVRVRSGPMTGIEGILVRRKDGFRVVLSINLLMSSVAAEVDESDVEPLN